MVTKMGEARRRGTTAARKTAAIKRNKTKMLELMGGRDERDDAVLRAGIAPFLIRLTPEAWGVRRQQILDALKEVDQGTELEKARPIRVQDDEICWYLFLCEQALEDPLCLDVNQLARAAPFFAGMGERWVHAARVKGIEQKIDEALHQYRSQPDGVLFEILVALSYAAKGWDVELLEQCPPAKSPDMRVTKDGVELFIECKRLARRTSYAEKERDDFLRLWDSAKHVLMTSRQWIWFKGVFHQEVNTLPEDFLAQKFEMALPLGAGEILIYDGPEATIHARLIDRAAVKRHLTEFRVKTNAPMLNHLLGGDWAPLNSSTTILKLASLSQVVDCDVPVLGSYVEDIAWACGFTRDFDSEVSVDKKAKDVTKHLADAVKQVPDDKPSIIHIAAETMEGKDVELRRTQKVMASIPNFITDKPVLAVRFHRFQANQTIDKLWEFDETVERFQVDGVALGDLPETVVVPESTEMRRGSHWEIYQ